MELLPCPFCGGTSVTVEEGTTYRWAVATCVDCGATASEVRAVPDVVKTQELALAEWNLRASPASVPEGFKHDIGAERFAVVRGSYWWHVRAGNGTQNIGKFHTELSAKEMALTLLTAFRDGAFMQYQADLAAAPTPPVSEDRWQPIETAPKDKFVLLAGPSGYTTIEIVYATGRMCSDYHVGRWIDHANDDLTDWGFEPTHWMPLPEAPAMQEDKP